MDEPCAYAIFENREPRTVTFLREQAEVWMAGNEKCTAVPLYRHPQPTLTVEEREAVAWAALAFGNKAEELGRQDDLWLRLCRQDDLWLRLLKAELTLRNLLARLS
jgi:hypothetical protein